MNLLSRTTAESLHGRLKFEIEILRDIDYVFASLTCIIIKWKKKAKTSDITQTCWTTIYFFCLLLNWYLWFLYIMGLLCRLSKFEIADHSPMWNSSFAKRQKIKVVIDAIYSKYIICQTFAIMVLMQCIRHIKPYWIGACSIVQKGAPDICLDVRLLSWLIWFECASSDLYNASN